MFSDASAFWKLSDKRIVVWGNVWMYVASQYVGKWKHGGQMDRRGRSDPYVSSFRGKQHNIFHHQNLFFFFKKSIIFMYHSCIMFFKVLSLSVYHIHVICNALERWHRVMFRPFFIIIFAWIDLIVPSIRKTVSKLKIVNILGKSRRNWTHISARNIQNIAQT